MEVTKTGTFVLANSNAFIDLRSLIKTQGTVKLISLLSPITVNSPISAPGSYGTPLFKF
jgi:hypothetical protein